MNESLLVRRKGERERERELSFLVLFAVWISSMGAPLYFCFLLYFVPSLLCILSLVFHASVSFPGLICKYFPVCYLTWFTVFPGGYIMV